MEHKQCKKCGDTKPLHEFSRKNATGRKPGYQPRCKACAATDTREWNVANKDSQRQRYLKNQYGISEEFYNELFESQQGKCRLCYRELKTQGLGPSRAVVDHCHKNGHVRGILCNECNRGLGYFHDNIMALENAVDYLKEN